MTQTQYSPAGMVTLAEGLIDGNTAAGSQVFPWRLVSMQDDELPAIGIYIIDSNLSRRGNDPNLLYRRTDTLTIQCHTLAPSGDTSQPEAHTILEECLRRVITDVDVRESFYPPEAITWDLSPDKDTNATRVIGTLNIDMRQDYQFEEVRVGDAMTTVHSTMDIDESGDAPDVETRATMTGGTP